MNQRLARAARVVARRAPSRLTSRSIDSFGPVFAEFERDDGSRIPLYSHYRDQIKQWRFYWWPVHVLDGLSRRVPLPPEPDELLSHIMNSTTLPVPAREIALLLGGLVDSFSDHLSITGTDAALEVLRVELIPRAADISRYAERYADSARGVCNVLRSHGGRIEGARVLDVGTGSGRLAFALAGLGASEVVGLDLEPEAGTPSLERAPVRDRLTGSGRARLQSGDVASIEADDGSFDIACSISAIEHFQDLPSALAELRRVLRPGGLMYHGVDPWFGKAGGHSLCTLDVPWGHVRLSPSEFERYLSELRPNERDDAVDFYRHGFQVPPRTLAESRAAFESSGLEVLDWHETPLRLRDPHRKLVTGTMVSDCRARYPSVTRGDLLALSYGVVARRPQ